MKQQPKDWNTCSDCGFKFFPEAKGMSFNGLTLMNGDCPDCEAKNVTLIPISDFKNKGHFTI